MVEWLPGYEEMTAGEVNDAIDNHDPSLEQLESLAEVEDRVTVQRHIEEAKSQFVPVVPTVRRTVAGIQFDGRNVKTVRRDTRVEEAIESGELEVVHGGQ